MKNKITRYVCFILALAILFSVNVSAIAPKPEIMASDYVTGKAYDVGEIARTTYENLSNEARILFDEVIARDSELTAFHHKYVDSTFSPEKNLVQHRNAVSTQAADLLTLLADNLAALALPEDVTYCLNAMGSGMVAALADGPLPIGEILLAAAAVRAVVVIAANWEEVSPQFNKIVKAFTAVFSDATSEVTSAFNEIKADVPAAKAGVGVSVSVKGKTVQIGAKKYECLTSVETLTEEDTRNKQYFVGILLGSDVFVDVSQKIGKTEAMMILTLNRGDIGVVAASRSYARGIVGGNPRGPERHGNRGYYEHYHNSLYPNAHIWYPLGL